MTTRLYLDEMDLLASTERIVELLPGERPIVRLARTIFHPQGGGQPADVGAIGSSAVLSVASSGPCIDHFVSSLEGLAVGDRVRLEVDGERRQVNSAFHTCTHHVANVMEQLYPSLRVSGGHSWPCEARVEFEGHIDCPPIEIERVADRIEFDRLANLPVELVRGPLGSRAVRIGDYPAIACGGTHIVELGQIASVRVASIRVKGPRLRVSFDCVASTRRPPLDQ